jgi:hypothetical protein
MPFVLIKEHRYTVQIGGEKQLLRVEEFLAGPAVWRDKFRLYIPADGNRMPETIYGTSADEVAEKGAAFMTR